MISIKKQICMIRPLKMPNGNHAHLCASAQGDDVQVVEDPEEELLRQLPVDQRRVLDGVVAVVRVGEQSAKFPVRSPIHGSILRLKKVCNFNY